jgi:acyl carrier protein
MLNTGWTHDQLTSRLKHLVAELSRTDLLDPEAIAADAPLMGSELGLDSLDALELAMSIEEEFGVTFSSREESHRAFTSIATLSACILAQLRSRAEARPRAAERASGFVLDGRASAVAGNPA